MGCLNKIVNHWMKIKRKRNSLIIILSSFFLIICSSCYRNYCDVITNSFEKQCSKDSLQCSVSFQEMFSYNWDKLYIFDSMLYPSEVSKALGFNCNCEIVPEGKKLFVFVRNNSIVKEQVSRCSDITFINMKENGVVKINKSSIYTMKRKIVNKKIQFLLYAQE
jgi:hypothetical protein